MAVPYARLTGTTQQPGTDGVAIIGIGGAMARRLLHLALAVVASVAGGAQLAIGACTDPTLTRIFLLATPHVGGSSPVSVVWWVDSTCGVVETGLLAGTDPAQLTPVGEPVYAGQEAYQQDLHIDRPGEYWIGAYARDEAGNRLEAAPQMVPVGVARSQATEGDVSPQASLSAQATYSGTDQDFLVPTGNPHLATLQSAYHPDFYERTTRSEILPSGRTVVHSQTLLSTSRADIEAAFRNPFVIEGAVYPVDAAAVTWQLNRAEAQFSQLGSPRPGVYAVGCRQIVDFTLDGTRRGTYRDCSGGAATSAFASRTASDLTDTSFFETSRIIQSGQTTAAYFIPAAPPGQRVQKAILRAHINGGGSPEALQQIRLSGKAPTVVNIDFCFPLVCSSWAEWDFTAEVRALATQGGGILSFTPDPIPYTAVSGGRFTGQIANYSLALRVNYPWRRGNQDGSLSIWFESDDCPRELKLVLSADTVRTDLPANQAAAAGIAHLGTHSIVTAQVSDCPTDGQPPAPVDVTLTIRPPVAHAAEDGGHLHDSSSRPTGAFDGRYFTAACSIDTFDAQGRGECTVLYLAGVLSGIETITASASGFEDATAKVTVRVPQRSGLPFEPLAPVPSLYVLVGAPSNNTTTNDPCRSPESLTSAHEQNHYGRNALVNYVVAIADRFFREASILLRVNDMSLPAGGLFEIGNNWQPPHQSHRTGRDADLGFSGVRNGACVELTPEQIKRLRAASEDITGLSVVQHGDHWHVQVPNL